MRTRTFNSGANRALRALLCSTFLSSWIGSAAFCSTTTLLRLHPGSTNPPSGAGFNVSLNGAVPLTPPTSPEVWNDLQIYAPPDQPFLIVGALASGGLAIELEQFPGWRAELPPEGYVSVRSLDQHQTIELWVDRHNTQTVTLRLPDSASLQLSAGNSARFESFKDATYNLFARGPVQARTADGQAQSLGPDKPPLTGGPVTRMTNDYGQVRLRRLTPRAAISMTGQPGSKVIANLEGRLTTLLPGLTERLEQANGSAVELELEPTAIRFNVQRGYFILSFPGAKDCQPHIWTGQQGRLRWDSDLLASEVLAGHQALLVALPPRRYAAVAPGGVLQLAQLSPVNCAAAAARGNVDLFDPVTPLPTRLGQAQTVVEAGKHPRDPKRLLIRLDFDERGKVIARDPSDNRTTLSPAEQTLHLDHSHRLLASHVPESRELRLQALAGAFLVRLGPASHLEFHLDELNTILCQAAPDWTSSRAQALARNSGPIAVLTETGQVLLSPGEEILIMSAGWTLGMQSDTTHSPLEPAGSIPAESLRP